LLLAYLSSRRDVSDKTKTILEDILDKAAEHTPAAGWDYLLQKISDREADIEAGIDGTAVRLILEKLASRARCEMEDVGPITQNTILEVFRDVCGYSPDDRALVLLQRLPGLGPLSAEDGTRCFVDGDLALAASAGEVYRFIENPYTQKKEWFAFQFGLGQLGIEVAAHLCGTTGSSKGRLSTALKQASIAAGLGILASDLVRVCISIGCGYSGEKVFIREAIVPELEFVNEMAPLNELEFQDCLVMRLDLPPFVAGQDLPRFIRTSFGTVLGRIGRQDLPDVFTECDFDRFAESAHSTSAILDMPIPLGARVMLTILKKLFVQRGSGRKETALYRGLDHKGKRLVPSILALLVREQLVLKLKGATEPVWLPAREHSARIRRLLSAPSKSEDPLIQLASTIAD